MLTAILFLLLTILSSTCISADDKGPVTFGSTVKLVHKETKKNLHSHAIAWGSGSGQQSVTTSGTQADKNSLWVLKESTHSNDPPPVGTPIKCGDIIRLEHMDTGKNLHSHLFRAALSGNQEVSGFGDKGKGDTGDNWKINCESSGEYWQRGKPISLSHEDTGFYLTSSRQHVFNHQNCGHQCPILDQGEVSSSRSKSANCLWTTGQGVYFPYEDTKTLKKDDDEDDEL